MRATRWVYLLVVVGLCLPTVQALASDARLEALTVQREYIEDYFNFRTYPTVAARYQNLVQASLGSREFGSFNDDLSVGVIGAGDNTNYGVFALFLNQTVSSESGFEQQQLDLTWAKAFSGVAVGATILYQNSSFEDSGLSNKETPIDADDGAQDLDDPNANFMGLNLGAKIDVSDNSLLELAAGFGKFTWEETDLGVVIGEDDGKLSYQFSGRLMSELTNRTTLVPLLQYAKMDLTAKPDPGDPDFEVSRTMLNLGLALHYEVNGNDLLVLGLSLDNEKDKFGTLEVSEWALPNLFVALEFDVYSWLTVRTGASKSFANLSIDPDIDWKDSSYSFGLGMGLHFDHFDVDATVDPEAIFTGGYFLSGEESEPLTRITATYYF
jgi:hypothetical protein